LLGLSILDLEWNALDSAERSATQAFEIEQSYRDEELYIQSSLLLARLLSTKGETAKAVKRLQSLITQTKRSLTIFEVEAWQARFALQVGDLTTVQRWYSARTQPDELPRIQQEQEELLLARLYLAQGKPETALQQLESWRVEAQAEGVSKVS
jgi:hypothetical protein